MENVQGEKWGPVIKAQSFGESNYSHLSQKMEITQSDLRFLKISKCPTVELLEILNNNVIGTPGHGMLYQQLGVSNKVNLIDDPHFVNLMHGDKIVGTCCFCNRSTTNSGKVNRAFYIRYFSFKDGYRRGSGVLKPIARRSELRKEIESILSGDQLGIEPTEKFFHYAYVDPFNSRSLLLCKEFGFEPVRQYAAIIFSRTNPRHREAIHEASLGDQDEIRKSLSHFNREYNMVSFENLFKTRKYYVLKDRTGQIVAGVQANSESWKIFSLPGVIGRAALNIFSYLPLFKKVINRNYHFLTLEGMYYKSGFEDSLEPLFETLLAKYNLNSAVIVVDTDSQLYRTLKSFKLGLANQLSNESRGNVICKFINFSDDDKKLFRGNPAYISGIDVT